MTEVHGHKIVKDCSTDIGEWAEEKLKKPGHMPEYDLVQLKYDGWWVGIVLKEGRGWVITSGAEVRKDFQLPARYRDATGVFVAEWMYGTHWSGENQRSGKFYIHDVAQLDCGTTHCYFWDEGTYRERLNFLYKNENLIKNIFGTERVEMVETYPRTMAPDLWKKEKDFEGVVLKKSQAIFNEKYGAIKVKRTFTIDYICIDIVEGEGKFKGMLGSIAGGLISRDTGKPFPVCAVGGGFSDAERQEIWKHKKKYVGRVFEASGKGLFRKMVLRHPNFCRWRDDKPASRCRMP